MNKAVSETSTRDEDDGTTDGADATETLALDPSEVKALADHDHPAFYPGEVIAGRYSIVGSIGRGGMGEVYEAVDQELGQRVAVKTLRPDGLESEPLRDRFRQEILLARQVTHPNVCRIFDLSFHKALGGRARQPLLSMELLSGETLAARLRRDGPLAPDEVRGLVVDVARGLSAAHEAGIVHCDLKSSNVMLVPHGQSSRAVVMDFGLASTSQVETDHTGSGSSDSRAGTPGYMAPEILSGDPATPAADIFSLGIVISEMLTGRRPERGIDDTEEEGMRLPDHPAIDTFWRPILKRCLDFDPARRFASAAALLDAVEEVGRAPLKRLLLAAAVGGALMLALTLAVFFGFSRHGPRPSVAVLTLQHAAADPALDWVSTALPQLLSSELALGESVRLIARDTLKQMRFDRPPGEAGALSADYLAEVRAVTGADYVLDGRYRAPAAAGPADVEVELELYAAEDGRRVDRFVSRGHTDDLTPLIDDLAVRVLARLRLPRRRADGPSLPPTEAARLFAEGLDELDAFRAQAAVPKLEAALAADASFLLARIALLRAHLELGDLLRAAEQASLALSTVGASEGGRTAPGGDAGGLRRVTRLELEALAAEAQQDWEEAHSKWMALWNFFPDDTEYGLGVARALLESSRGFDALETVDRLRQLVPHLDKDPRLDLAEARAAGLSGDYERQLDAAERAHEKAEKLESLLLQARARLQSSAALRSTRSVTEALLEARTAHQLFEQVGHRSGAARALLEESHCLRETRELDAAARSALEARQIYASLGHRRGVADALAKLAGSKLSEKAGEARDLYTQALAEYRAIGNQKKAAEMLLNVGLTYVWEREYERVLEYYRQALAIFQSSKDAVGESMALNNLGHYHYHFENNVDAATEALNQSLAIKRRIHDRLTGITTLINLGNVHVRSGHLKEAFANYGEALDEALRMQRNSHIATALKGRAEVLYYQDHLSEAEKALNRALEIRDRLPGSPTDHERWLLGRVYLEQGRNAEAVTIAETLLGSGWPLDRQRGQYLLALTLTRQVRPLEARARLSKVEAQGNNEYWTDLDIRRRLLEARLLGLEGRLPEAREANHAAGEMAARDSFKALELEARRFHCELKETGEDAASCLHQVRGEADGMRFHL